MVFVTSLLLRHPSPSLPNTMVSALMCRPLPHAWTRQQRLHKLLWGRGMASRYTQEARTDIFPEFILTSSVSTPSLSCPSQVFWAAC